MKKKMISLTLTLIMSLSVIACSSAPEKEPDVVPEVVPEVVAEEIAEEPVENIEENKVVMEITEEYADEAAEFAEIALSTLFKKNDEYGDAERRDAIDKISHPAFAEDVELIHLELDKTKDIEITSISTGEIKINSGTLLGEKTDSFAVDYRIDYKSEGEDGFDEGYVLIFVEDGEFKYGSIYALQD